MLDAFETMLQTGSTTHNINALKPSSESIKTADQIRLEWLQQRWGKFTASEFHKLVAYQDKDELPKGGQTYARQKAVELLTECKPDNYVSPAMQWGIDHEHEALDAFIAQTGLAVEACKDGQQFVTLGDSVGGTPDGVIPSILSGVEIKCPQSATHLDYLDHVTDASSLKLVAPEYYWQCQGLMMLTGAETWFFVSYDPRFLDDSLRLHIATIERDEDDIDRLKRRLDLAIEARDAIVAKRAGHSHQQQVRKALAQCTSAQETMRDKIMELMQRVALLEEAKEKRQRKPREPQTAKITQETTETNPPQDDPDDLDVEDAEGLSSHVDYPEEIIPPSESIMPSQVYYGWLSIIHDIHTLSDIGRVAHELKASDLPKQEVDELLKHLVHRQQEIKNG